MIQNSDTIAAIATPPGNGGVGIIRISGYQTLQIAQQLTHKSPKPRYAQYCRFLDAEQRIIDTGLILYFAGPASFTGEDILELQAHGGSVVLDMHHQRYRTSRTLGTTIHARCVFRTDQ
jgi:tRNA modification GTPase